MPSRSVEPRVYRAKARKASNRKRPPANTNASNKKTRAIKWKEPDPNYQIAKYSDPKTYNEEVWRHHFRETDFEQFAKDAYESPDTYAIRTNPQTGEKEMFVAGTQMRKKDMIAGQWIQNVADLGLKGLDNHFEKNLPESMHYHPFMKADVARSNAVKKMQKAAKDNDVEVVYGHSRGAAIVSDMKLPDSTKKVGLDGAMVIAHDPDMLNIQSGSPFDKGLSLGNRKGNRTIRWKQDGGWLANAIGHWTYAPKKKKPSSKHFKEAKKKKRGSSNDFAIVKPPSARSKRKGLSIRKPEGSAAAKKQRKRDDTWLDIKRPKKGPRYMSDSD
ncbi:MAG: hypothetical protein [Avonheates virus SG_61]|uniref:hypothetical protein n=1 Tax=Avonheates virus SG_61 TaxID=2914487 RepID=UPI002481E1D2|nr:MAG: hypothetical protein QKV61_gp3 [Avonheates virus SG_61]UNI72621.1 MAG: hypothetical protein [Avonheates virus SG_61]